jgi:Ca2+-binding EF-hand superfamily protein
VRTLVILVILLTVVTSALSAGKQRQAKRQQKDALLERYDVNRNGTLDAEEVTAVEKDFLDRFDKNGDKKLDKDELEAVRQEVAQQDAAKLRKKKK